MADPIDVVLGLQAPNAPVTADVMQAAQQGRQRQQKQQGYAAQVTGGDPFMHAWALAQALRGGPPAAASAQPAAGAQWQNLMAGGPND